MYKSVFICFLLGLLPLITKAQSYTVNGYISDSSTKEILIGATVYNREKAIGASTNSYGFYSITLPKSKVILNFQYMGYKTVELELDLKKDTTVNMELSHSVLELETLTVMGGSNTVDNVRTGTINIPINKIISTPVLMGESDLMKSLQYIPGVQNTSEGKSDLSIRGGSPDQNLILLDGNPIYNASHVFGFLSVFNTDALKKVTLYKSVFPARFGGRLSSVIDINTKDGNKQNFEGSATLGLLALKFNIEGPIIKDKTSFTFSARRSYADLFMGKLQEILSDDESNKSTTKLFFYDINAKVHHKFNDKTSLYLMTYNGRDKLLNTTSDKDIPDEVINSTTEQDWKWGSTIFATRLNSALTKNLFINSTLSYNNYRYHTSIDKQSTFIDNKNSTNLRNKIDYESGIRDYTGTLEFEFIPTTAHYIRFGTQFIYHNFKPETLNTTISDESLHIVTKPTKNINAKELSLYAEDDWEISRKLQLNVGARFSIFAVNKENYTTIDPRVSLRYKITDDMSVKAGYSQMQQYIHLLSNNSLLLQTDLWVPATDKIKPMNSTQYSVGWFMNLYQSFNISFEGYYKNMNNIIEYKDGASFTGESGGWEDKVEVGIGHSFGMEISLEKKIGKTTGSLSYAWSKTERKFDNINLGKWFPAKYDRRNNIFLGVSHKLNEKIDFMANWVFASGDMMTIPLMSVETPDIPDSRGKDGDLTQLDHRNNYRMPFYHRLDLGINYIARKRERNYGVWSLSIYNVYNRMNPFKIYIETDVHKNESDKKIYTQKLKQITMFPIMPSISYTYNF